MKYTNIVLALVVLLCFSCGSDYSLEDDFTLTDLPGYVAFDAPGNSVVLEDIVIAEDGGTATLTIEVPTGTLSDVTVGYAFSGDAVFGTDFNVAGASAAGGSIILTHRPTDFQNRDNVDLDIEILMDGAQDGNKTLTVTLVSASNAEGGLAVGRGGTDFLKSANVIMEDID